MRSYKQHIKNYSEQGNMNVQLKTLLLKKP